MTNNLVPDENIGQGLTNPFPGQALEWVDFSFVQDYSGDRDRGFTDDPSEATCVTSRRVNPDYDTAYAEKWSAWVSGGFKGEAPTSEEGKSLDPRMHFGEAHKPVIDLDFPAKVVPSSTPGHCHLFLDKPLHWNDFMKLLRVMEEIGLVEPGYVGASEHRGHTSVRLPHVKKGDPGVLNGEAPARCAEMTMVGPFPAGLCTLILNEDGTCPGADKHVKVTP